MSTIVEGVVENKASFGPKANRKGGEFMENVLTVNGEKYKKLSDVGVDPFSDVLEGSEVKMLVDINNTKGRDGRVFTNRNIKHIEVSDDSVGSEPVETVSETTSTAPATTTTTITKASTSTGKPLPSKDHMIARMNAVTSSIAFLGNITLKDKDGNKVSATIGDVITVAEAILKYTTEPMTK